MFTGPGRGLVFAGVVALAVLIGIGVAVKHADSAPLAPFAWIGR
jgi:hypothetical protein